jgi:Fic family protein
VGFSTDAELGRPRHTDIADDPLSLGTLPSARVAAQRLSLLADVLTTSTQAPALLVAAIAHGEVAVLRPFAWGSGLIARACARLVMAGRGVDPSLFTIPERGILESGRPAYVKALRAYASGTPDGVRDFIVWHSTAVALGARAVHIPS